MPSALSQLSAFSVCVARYVATVAPIVNRELQRWRDRAEKIPDPVLREYARANLRDAAAHAQVAGLILTLAPRPYRGSAVVAAVAIEVAYDYLDTITEQPVPDPLGDGAQLYEAFEFALGGQQFSDPLDDGGYLLALATACRLAFLSLPSASVVEADARRIARLCGEAQTRTHAARALGAGQLADWSRQHRIGRLLWWEVAAGWCAGVLAIHALIAAAADPTTTERGAQATAAAYLRIAVLTTLLDSLKDRVADTAASAHSFVSCYPSDAELADALIDAAFEALVACALTPHRTHDAMTVAGCAAFYCSGIQDAAVEPLLAELRPTVTPILAMFTAWRRRSLRH